MKIALNLAMGCGAELQWGYERNINMHFYSWLYFTDRCTKGHTAGVLRTVRRGITLFSAFIMTANLNSGTCLGIPKACGPCVFCFVACWKLCSLWNYQFSPVLVSVILRFPIAAHWLSPDFFFLLGTFWFSEGLSLEVVCAPGNQSIFFLLLP